MSAAAAVVAAAAAAVVVAAAAHVVAAAAAEEDDEDQDDPDGVVIVVAEHSVYPFSALDDIRLSLAARSDRRAGIRVRVLKAERRRSPLSPLSYASPDRGVTADRSIPVNRRM